MNFDTLDGIDWDGLKSTEDWIKTLNDLRGLIDSADTPAKRDKLADKLDEFADHSTSDDLATIVKLDSSARKAARALRKANIADSVAELAAASSEFQSAVKEFNAASAALKKEASLLRAEKFTAAVSALTGTISAVKGLTQVVLDQDDPKLAAAITAAVNSAQKLRTLLEAQS
jgi:hypothetical protein